MKFLPLLLILTSCCAVGGFKKNYVAFCPIPTCMLPTAAYQTNMAGGHSVTNGTVQEIQCSFQCAKGHEFNGTYEKFIPTVKMIFEVPAMKQVKPVRTVTRAQSPRAAK